MTRRSLASLRITSEVLSPDKISRILQLTPSRIYTKGERLSKRNKYSALRTENLWIFDSGLDQMCSLEEHIDELINIIYPKKNMFNLLSEYCIFDIFCYYSVDNSINQSIFLESKTLKKIVELQIDIIFNIY